jgi:hypothetical protein
MMVLWNGAEHGLTNCHQAIASPQPVPWHKKPPRNRREIHGDASEPNLLVPLQPLIERTRPDQYQLLELLDAMLCGVFQSPD